MKTIAFFNNKGGVGKTILVYHLSWMFQELGYRALAIDLDPQANLSAMFLEEDKLEDIWNHKDGYTVYHAIQPLSKGTGDIEPPHIEHVEHVSHDVPGLDAPGLLVGDILLSQYEDDLSQTWPKCMDKDERSFRVTTAFSRLIAQAGEQYNADLVLVDVGPNFGAINRSALIACDYTILPLSPDLFSVRALSNVGPILKQWREGWKQRKEQKAENLDIRLPEGNMYPLGYTVMRHGIRAGEMVKAYKRWFDKIPEVYQETVLSDKQPNKQKPIDPEKDDNCLALLKDYHSLMPMAQEKHKPIFLLTTQDDVFGGQLQNVHKCKENFEEFAHKILDKIEKNSDKERSDDDSSK